MFEQSICVLDRVLVVDDSVDLSAAYANCLSDCGYEVDLAHSYTDALNQISCCEYSVIAADLKLSDGSGVRLTEIALQRFPKRATKFIWISARCSVSDISRGMRIGVCGFLQKPFGCDDLKSAVARACSLRREYVNRDGANQKALAVLRAIRAAGDDLATTLVESGDPTSVDLTQIDPLQLMHELSGEADRFFAANELVRSFTNLSGWLVLLSIAKSDAAGKGTSIKAVSLMTRMPMSTTLRKVAELEGVGLVSTVPDPSDGRRSFVQLSAKACEMLRRYLQATRRVA